MNVDNKVYVFFLAVLSCQPSICIGRARIGCSEDYCGTCGKAEWLRGLTADFDIGDDGGTDQRLDLPQRSHD
jgi:hypothetical protein